MLKTGIFFCAMSLAVPTIIYAGGVIEIDKLSKAQRSEVLKTASDNTVIEYKGQTKSLAEWRSYFQPKFKSLDSAGLKEAADERKAKFEAAAKALQDEQDKQVAEENARTEAEFDALRSQ
jgi:hypothetical protein